MKRRKPKCAVATGRIAIGYCRCSSEKQAERTEYNTLQSQENLIREYFLKHCPPEWELVILHEVRSAKDIRRRPVLQQVLERVRNGEVAALLVLKHDRLARNLLDQLMIRALLKEHGTRLITILDPPLEDETPVGELSYHLLAAIAQFERRQTAQRVYAKMRDMSCRGLWVRGRPPFGYRLNRATKKLEVDAEAAAWVRWIFQRFRETGCVGLVAQELQGNPEFMRVRRTRGYSMHVRTDRLIEDTLRNPIYVGDLYYGGELAAREAFEPIIERDLFELVQALLPNNRRYAACYSPATQEDPYLLRGSIFCYECGGVLTPRWVQGNRLVHYYDHPRKSFCSFQRVNAERVHRAVWRVLGVVAQMDGLTETALLESEQAAVERSRREAARIGQEIERLLLLAREGLGDLPELSRQIAALQARRAELAREIRGVDEATCRALLSAFRRALAQWELTYERASLSQRRELFALLVSRVEVGKSFCRVWVPVPGKVRIEEPSGGAERIRTADLLHAMQARRC